MASSSSTTAAATSYSVPTVGSSPLLRPSSFSSLSCAYEVFLSFRGVHIRKTFIDHLYEALDRRGIYTFKDDNRLQGGESISDQLSKAIEQSRSAIVVFSANYASSGWCLDELEKIMDCKDKQRLAVYPVFYDVPPSDVRGQRGTFGEGFAKAIERKGEKADVWRKALRDAANLSGYDIQNTADGHESQCIKQIVKWFWNKYSNIFASFDENLIGIKPRVQKLVSLLGRDSDDDVRMIGIWGMGGIGKTTLAHVTFHELKKQFDGASFIADVREKSKRIDGLQLLQKKILSDIMMDDMVKVDNVPEGKKMIKRILDHKKVLIVLDDVDNDEQLRALAGDHKWFGKGSRILVTTRDRHLLEAHGVDENDIHSLNLLSKDEAILLFNRNAFKKYSPTIEYDELTLLVVRYAAGLPLALTVLGSFLCGRGMAEWTSALKRLEKIQEGEILEKLQISYDGLKEVEKEIFLDIACFFKGWKKDKVIRMLDSCEFDSVIGIDVLVDKSLISLSNEDEKFQIHDLLQDMGRNIGRHRRLWHFEDIEDVLQNNTGTEAIEAIVGEWDYPSLKGHTCWWYPRRNGHTSCDSKALMSMKKLRFLHLNLYGYTSCDSKNPYKGMKKPRSLKKYRYTPFVRGSGYDLPNELQWLSWEGYPRKSLAESFQAPKLVGLEMQSCHIVHLWKGKKLLDKLTFIDLRGSRKLIRTPDFSGIPNLKELNLGYCTSLIEVHPSLGDLQRLVLLNLEMCNNLVDFPSNIHMKFLEILDFSGCWKFKRFPELRGNMDRLSKLSLICTAIEGLPSSIANLTKLVSINLCGCNNLLDLPDTICMLKNLKKINLNSCYKLRKLPENLGHIESLEELNVSRTGVKVLPSSVGHLKKLTHVSLSGCCKLILEVSMTHIGSCLKVLDLGSCKLSDHQAIPIDVGQLSFLEKLVLSDNPFASLPFIISQLSRLKILDLSECRNLKTLPELPSSIAILEADNCTSLESIECLSAGKHEWLWKVSLRGCNSLTMHEKCDPLHCRHEQENSSTTGQQPKHCKKLSLLQSMLQGQQAVVNHRLSICYAEGSVGRAIPEWFGQEVMTGNMFVLKLPTNWQNKITGFAMCVVFNWSIWGTIINLHIGLSEEGRQIPGLHAKRARSPTDGYYDVWIGYISVKMLQRSIESESVTWWTDWMDRATQLFFKFSAKPFGSNPFDDDDGYSDVWIESCAARVVCMDEVENSEAIILSPSLNRSSSSRNLQQHDPNFAAETMIPCSTVSGKAKGITLLLDHSLGI